MSYTPHGTSEYAPTTIPDDPTRPSTPVPDQQSGDQSLDAGPSPTKFDLGTLTQLVIKRGPDAGTRIPITSTDTVIGRHRDCDIVLDDVTVSRRHARLHVQGHRYTIADAGSLNGTYLNRQPVETAELTDGDEVWIGKFRLTFHTAR